MISMSFSMMYGKETSPLGFFSYLLVGLACLIGLAATFAWWRSADQAK
jgi:predicted ribosomally synthesized peptide with SipW-like signal peptide